MFELTKNKVQGMIKNTRAALKIELLDFNRCSYNGYGIQ